MCLSIYETADGKIQLMEDQPIGKKTNGADMVFQKKYIGYLWVSLRIEISLLNYISAIFFWGSGTSFAKMLQSRNPKESYDPWFAEVYL